jgi:hypothetical protein
MNRALLLGWLTLCASGCGGTSPTSPSDATISFQGAWTGTWAMQECSETGGAIGNGCSGLPSTGYLGATLTQTGTSVEGTVEIEVFLARVTGQVDGSGVLTLSGSGRLLTVTVTIADWRASQDGNVLTGTFTYVVTPDDPTLGVITVRAALQNVTRS